MRDATRSWSCARPRPSKVPEGKVPYVIIPRRMARWYRS